jgi:hypothetical protein
MRRCVRQAPAQPPLGRGLERLHRAVHLQIGGPHGRRQRRRLLGCSRHRIQQRRRHTVQLIIHLKLNLPRKSLLIGHEFLCGVDSLLLRDPLSDYCFHYYYYHVLGPAGDIAHQSVQYVCALFSLCAATFSKGGNLISIVLSMMHV